MSVFLRDLSLRESLVAKVPKLIQVVRFQHLLALWTAGAATLAFATWVCLRLGLNSETTICVHLIIIVLLSLMDSIASSIIFSIIAVGCLDYFFIKPLYSFSVASAEDLTAIAAFLVASIVITSLVRRLQQLGQAHREQAQLLDLTSDSILVLDSENVITYWNRGSEELYGWKRQEALGKVSHQLLQTTFPASLEQINEIVLRIGHWEGELIRTGRDGRQIIATSRWSLQRGEDGRALGMLETNNDITERRRAEDALRRIQETYLAEAQQLSHTGSFGWNVPTGELFLSKEGVRIFDFGSDARPSLEMMLARTHPEDMNLVRGVADRAAKERRDFDLEYRLLMPDSTVKYIHVVARAIPIDSSGVDLIGAVMDVTVIRRAQAELHKTRSELTHLMRVATVGELTASIAHEINQSLGAVVANAEASLGWLDRENPDLHEAQVAIERIVTDGHRAGKVIKRIRALVKKTDTQMAPVKLNELVSETVDLVRHELLSNHVMLEAELATEALVVLGDKIQLQQVLLNMIMNGIEAMQPIKDRPRELIVRSENVSAQQAQITVKDCGIGIPVESAQRIFEAFMTTKATGMGMGLSICRSIIEAHAGSIWASPSEPHGAAVQFTIPLHRSIVS